MPETDLLIYQVVDISVPTLNEYVIGIVVVGASVNCNDSCTTLLELGTSDNAVATHVLFLNNAKIIFLLLDGILIPEC
jgi:hypothetical protein